VKKNLLQKSHHGRRANLCLNIDCVGWSTEKQAIVPLKPQKEACGSNPQLNPTLSVEPRGHANHTATPLAACQISRILQHAKTTRRRINRDLNTCVKDGEINFWRISGRYLLAWFENENSMSRLLTYIRSAHPRASSNFIRTFQFCGAMLYEENTRINCSSYTEICWTTLKRSTIFQYFHSGPRTNKIRPPTISRILNSWISWCW
jgi:hypothetical protein